MPQEPQAMEVPDPDGRLASLPPYLRQSVEWGIIDAQTAVRINIIRRAAADAVAEEAEPAGTPSSDAPIVDEVDEADEEVAYADSLEAPTPADIDPHEEPDAGLPPSAGEVFEPIPDLVEPTVAPVAQAPLEFVEDEVEADAPTSYLPWDQPYIPALVDKPPDKNLRFDTLVPFRANAVAIEIAQNVARGDDTLGAYNPFYVYGDVGLGKTHLLSALVNHRRHDSLLVNVADLEAELERAMRLGTRAELRRWLTARSLLVVDDVHLCEGNDALQRELLSVLNSMLDNGRIVVVSADLPPTRLKGVDPQLIGRLSGGVITALHMGDRDERMVILRDWLPGNRVPDEVLTRLGDQITDSVRHLKAVSARVSFLARQPGKQVTVALAEEALLADAESLTMPAPVSAPRSAPKTPAAPALSAAVSSPVVERFQKIVCRARTEGEESLALQVAIGERLREVRGQVEKQDETARLREALDLVRAHKPQEALDLLAKAL